MRWTPEPFRAFALIVGVGLGLPGHASPSESAPAAPPSGADPAGPEPQDSTGAATADDTGDDTSEGGDDSGEPTGPILLDDAPLFIPDPTPPPPMIVGSVLPIAPRIAPGHVPALPKDPLEVGRARYLDGDMQGTIQALSPWLDSRSGPWGRARTSGHLLLGMAHFNQENWNLASRHFYRVRRTDGPLAAYGAWYEALVDHRRGRDSVAIRECTAYRTKFPDGAHADECLLLIGDAYSARGLRSSAVTSYEKYLDAHPKTPRQEEIALAKAIATARSSPARGIQLLQGLALNHSYPSTDLAVQAELAALQEAGHDALLPDTPDIKMRRATTLRRSGKHAEAWQAFQDLSAFSADNPSIAKWIEDNEESFAWGTRQYDVYARSLAQTYEESPSADIAWRIFRAWSRDGNWPEAVAWGRKGLDVHKTDWRWRQAMDDMAWAVMLNGEYGEAQQRWETLAKRGGSFGRKARFYAGFSAVRGGDWEAASALLEPLTTRGQEWRAPACYWRAKALEALGDDTEAANHRALARGLDRSGWYALLLSERGDDRPAWLDRDGQWGGPAIATLPPMHPISTRTAMALTPWPSPQPLTADPADRRAALLNPVDDQSTSPDWGALSWSTVRAGGDVATPDVIAAGALGQVPSGRPPLPDGYLPSRWWDPAQAEKDFYRFAEARKDLWPQLPAAYDLASAGLYGESAKLIHAAYAEWQRVVKKGPGEDPREQAIAALGLGVRDWRPFLILTRDHYHAARATSGLDKGATTPEERIAALRLAYPVVHPAEVWAWSQKYGLDPWLVMSIMRQESTYRNTALSPVGAIGLVQVMPKTGAKVAALLGETRYSPGALEDPSTNLRYGIYYLSQLMERFDGAFPLAVASYNGGPHNVSRWYRGKEGEIELDAFVEQIQYDETRDYVKRVSGHYSRYVRIYEGPSARVLLPERPTGDDPSVINF